MINAQGYIIMDFDQKWLWFIGLPLFFTVVTGKLTI